MASDHLKKNDERRLRVYWMPPESMLYLIGHFGRGEYMRICGCNMPADARFVSCSWDFNRQCFGLLMRHQSFHEVQYGDAIPWGEMGEMELMPQEPARADVSTVQVQKAIDQPTLETIDESGMKFSDGSILPIPKEFDVRFFGWGERHNMPCQHWHLRNKLGDVVDLYPGAFKRDVIEALEQVAPSMPEVYFSPPPDFDAQLAALAEKMDYGMPEGAKQGEVEVAAWMTVDPDADQPQIVEG